jgi:hypothetical protein
MRCISTVFFLWLLLQNRNWTADTLCNQGWLMMIIVAYVTKLLIPPSIYPLNALLQTRSGTIHNAGTYAISGGLQPRLGV